MVVKQQHKVKFACITVFQNTSIFPSPLLPNSQRPCFSMASKFYISIFSSFFIHPSPKVAFSPVLPTDLTFSSSYLLQALHLSLTLKRCYFRSYQNIFNVTVFCSVVHHFVFCYIELHLLQNQPLFQFVEIPLELFKNCCQFSE